MPTWFLTLVVLGVVVSVICNAAWMLLLRGWAAPGSHVSTQSPSAGDPKATLPNNRPNPLAPTLGRSSIGSGIEMDESRLLVSPRFRSGTRWIFDRADIGESQVRWVPGGSAVILFDREGNRAAILFSAHPVAATRRSLADGGWLGRWATS